LSLYAGGEGRAQAGFDEALARDGAIAMRQIDYDAGTSRFTPALAQAFGPVTGIEPSVRMREIALPLHEVIATFTAAGWREISFGTVAEPPAGTRADVLGRLRLRTLSTFACFTPGELDTGFGRLEEAVAADPDAPVPRDSATLLPLARC
jgi:hypothetical protein